MKLTQDPEIVTWPETHYVFVEKTGPFLIAAPQAWQKLHQLTPQVSEHNQITGYMSLYKTGPKIYRAGLALATSPTDLPGDLEYLKFAGSKYNRFVLTGSFSNLPEASRRVFELSPRKKSSSATTTALRIT